MEMRILFNIQITANNSSPNIGLIMKRTTDKLFTYCGRFALQIHHVSRACLVWTTYRRQHSDTTELPSRILIGSNSVEYTPPVAICRRDMKLAKGR